MTEIQGKSILVRVSERFELVRVRVIGSRLYIHSGRSIPLVEHLRGKGEKEFLIACLRHRFNTTLRVSSSYDTEWFDYNEVVCSTELIEWDRTYSTPPPHWK